MLKQLAVPDSHLSITSFAKIACLYLLSLSLLFACSSDEAQEKNSSENKSVEFAEKHTRVVKLENGVEALLVSMGSSGRTVISVSINAGLSDGPQEFLGLAHLLEHVIVIGGSKQNPEPNSLHSFVERYHGSVNAYTVPFFTSYVIEIPNEQIEMAVELLGAALKSPNFSESIVSTEVLNVDSEWKMREDDEAYNVYAAERQTVSEGNSIRRAFIGNANTLGAADPERLKGALKVFYKKHYLASNIKITVLSDSGMDAMEDLVRDNFSDFVSGEPSSDSALAEKRPEKLSGRILYRSLKGVRELYLDYPIKDNTQDWESKANDYLAAAMMHAGENGLVDTLKRNAWIADLQVTVEPQRYGDSGLLRVYVYLTEAGEAFQDEIIAAVSSYIDQLRVQGITEEYYLDLQGRREREFNNRSFSIVGEAVRISREMFQIPAAQTPNHSSLFSEFDEAKISSVFEYLNLDELRIWHLSPTQEAQQAIPNFKAKFRQQEISDAEREYWRELAKQFSFALPSKNPFVSGAEFEIEEYVYEKPNLIVDTPAMELWLAHSIKNDNGYGFIRLEWRSSYGQRNVKEFVLGCLLNDVLQLRLSPNISQLSEAGQWVNLNRSSANNQLISLQGSSALHAEIANLLVNEFQTLAIEDSMFNEVNNRFQRWVTSWSDANPADRALGYLQDFYNIKGFSQADMIEVSKELQFGDLRQYYENVMDNHQLRMFAFGNYSEKAMKSFSQKLQVDDGQKQPLVELLKANRIEAANREAPRNSNLATVDHYVQTNQNDLAYMQAYVYPHASAYIDAHFIVLRGIHHAEFFKRLRTERAIGYTAFTTNYSTSANLPVFASVIQSAGASLDDMSAATEDFYENFTQYLSSLSESDVEIIKREILNLRNAKNTLNNEVDMYISDFDRRINSFDSYETINAEISRLNKSSLEAVYRDVIMAGSSSDRFQQASRHKVFVNADSK